MTSALASSRDANRQPIVVQDCDDFNLPHSRSCETLQHIDQYIGKALLVHARESLPGAWPKGQVYVFEYVYIGDASLQCQPEVFNAFRLHNRLINEVYRSQ